MYLEGNLVDVESEEIYPARIEFDKSISKIKKLDKRFNDYLLPGFIDAHIHIESSFLIPTRFAEVVIPHGTVAVVCDFHEIANVAGMEGSQWFRKNALQSPLKFFFTAPSCVPSSKFEMGGAKLGAKEVKEILSWKECVALGEVMDIEGLFSNEKDLLKKIELAKEMNKPIDGHAPGLIGNKLKKYASYGISTDHESSSLREAKEKIKAGMKVGIREGTVAKNLRDLVKPRKLDYSRCFLVSDDVEVSELIKEGHVDRLLRKAIANGVDPIEAIRMVTLNPANHYRCEGGIIKVGKPADIVVVDNLRKIKVKRVFINGVEVARNGKYLLKVPTPKKFKPIFEVKKISPSDIAITTEKEKVRVRVIKILKNQLTTKAIKARLNVIDHKVNSDTSKDILKLCVVDRYGRGLIGKGFVKGFKLKKGAIASSIAHDSHNIVAVGVNDIDCAKAINEISKMKGGLVVVDEKKISKMNLPIGGLMSPEPASLVYKKIENLKIHCQKNGCKLQNPFMQLSFLSLPVIPELRLTTRGLFDVKREKFVKAVIEN